MNDPQDPKYPATPQKEAVRDISSLLEGIPGIDLGQEEFQPTTTPATAAPTNLPTTPPHPVATNDQNLTYVRGFIKTLEQDANTNPVRPADVISALQPDPFTNVSEPAGSFTKQDLLRVADPSKNR